MKKILLSITFTAIALITAAQKPVDYLMKGKALIQTGKPDEAVNILSEALKSYPETALYLSRAEAYMAKGD